MADIHGSAAQRCEFEPNSRVAFAWARTHARSRLAKQQTHSWAVYHSHIPDGGQCEFSSAPTCLAIPFDGLAAVSR
jgi:hypothetical protein